MIHYLDANNELWAFNSALPDEEVADRGFRVATDEEVQAIQNPPLTADKIRANYEGAAQVMLDDFAKSWGYDSLSRAATYFNSKNAKYKAECDALTGWRDDVWTASESIDEAVRNGGTPPANEASFLAMLPAAPSRPTV